MLQLPITLITASVLTLMLIWLSVRVIGGRVKGDVLIGDGNGQDLLFRIRSQGNFAEYAPLFVIVLGLVEFSGGHRLALMTVAAVFIVARFLHVFGMGPDAKLVLRQAGMLGTFFCLLAVSLYGLYLGLLS